MSDCPKCWCTPCECGWEYRNYTVERLDNLAKVLLKIKEFKESNPSSVFSFYVNHKTPDDLALMQFLRTTVTK